MKTKLTILIIALLLFNSCDMFKSNSMELVTSFCDEPCAITENFKYDTEKATAYYEVIIPKDGVLGKKNQNGNTITYTCTGGDGTSTTVQIKPESVTGLSDILESKLTIIVTYKNVNCGESSFIDKKKTSVVQGHPITPDLKCY